jgi:hypothetical protein
MMPLPHEPKIVNHANPYSADRFEIPAQEDTSSTFFASTKMRSIWRFVASLFLTLGWVVPLLLLAVTIIADAWNLEVLEQAARSTAEFAFRVLSFKSQFRFLPLLVPIMGLVGLLMLLSSTSYIHRWRPFRIWVLLTGVTAVLPIILIALAVDAQPPGSGLAMFVTIFGAYMGPVLVLGISTGILGLMMYLPTNWISTDSRQVGSPCRRCRQD